MGNSTVAYTYGMQRESYIMTQSVAAAGGITESLTSHSSGTYYYTGTGSVANLVSGGRNTAYTYSGYGARTVYRADMNGYTDVTAISYTYENYGYNGEYTHENLGIQYLRARYYSMGTGTFTSRDTYTGTLTGILSQNRYTYAENNPITYADPSGHAKSRGGLSSLRNNIKIANGGNRKNAKQPVNDPTAAAKAMYQSRRESLALPKENTLLDNVRITNGYERYAELLFQQPDTRLISNLGGFSSQEELVQAQAAAVQRCLAYDYCLNEVQNIIYGNRLITFDQELYETNKFYKTTADYIWQIQNDELTEKQKEELQEIRNAYLKNIDRYKEISQKSGLIPPEVIAAIHYRENATDFLNGSFTVYLHNGDPLGEPSSNVPYPDFGEDAFDEAALDALKGYDDVSDSNYLENRAETLNLTTDSRDLTAMVTYTSFFQGWKNYPNNYVYSGTSIYQSGVYVADHVYDENAVDQNYGTYLVLKILLE